MKKEMLIEGMTWGHCKMRVSNALNELDGVTEVTVDLEANKASFEVNDSVTDEVLTEAIEDVGYDVVEIK